MGWIKRFIWFHDKRHPREMGPTEVEAFLSSLATQRGVSASTRNPALCALLFRCWKRPMTCNRPGADGASGCDHDPNLDPCATARRVGHAESRGCIAGRAAAEPQRGLRTPDYRANRAGTGSSIFPGAHSPSPLPDSGPWKSPGAACRLAELSTKHAPPRPACGGIRTAPPGPRAAGSNPSNPDGIRGRLLSEDGMKRYSLALSGELSPGADRAAAIATLTELFRLSPPQSETLLSGRPRQLKGFVSLDQVRHAQERLKGVGIPCDIRDEAPAPAPSPTAAEAFARPSALNLESATQRCPKCDEEQPPGDICRRCGIAFAKFRPSERQAPAPRRPVAAPPRESTFPYRLVNQLVLLVFLSGLGLAIWSHWKKDQLPPPSFYDTSQLGEPLQTPTDSRPFQIEAQGIQYTIEPLFDYRLEGVVVSLHDADELGGIYHFKEWKDSSTSATCASSGGTTSRPAPFGTCDTGTAPGPAGSPPTMPWRPNASVWTSFSNNHLLSHDPAIQAAIKSAEIGDHIRLTGQLARYSHAGGFSRGSSVVRTDYR